MNEIWKDIPGHPNYQASSWGRIRSVDVVEEIANRWGGTTTRLRHGKILVPWVNKKGYHYTPLGAKHRKETHYWVAIAFLGPRTAGLEVNHKDGNKANNAAVNLEWTTRSANIQHAFAHGLNHSGSKHGISKLNETQAIEIKKLLTGKKKRQKPFYEDIAKIYGVSRKTIEAIAKNRTWRQV